jgi:hypothetical protein
MQETDPVSGHHLKSKTYTSGTPEVFDVFGQVFYFIKMLVSGTAGRKRPASLIA